MLVLGFLALSFPAFYSITTVFTLHKRLLCVYKRLINAYHFQMQQSNSLSLSAINQSVSAINLYFNNVLKRVIKSDKLIRPKKGKTMPRVYSKEEMQGIIFAAHLPESGVDIRKIQTLPGHESTKTTEIYTHIPKKLPGSIKNPLAGFDV